MIRKVNLFIFFTILLVACSPNKVYDKNTELNNDTWILADTLNFDFDIKNDSETYDIALNIRNNVHYPFQNLHVKYTLSDSINPEIAKGSVNAQLFERRTGKPVGKGVGSLYDVQKMLLTEYKFSKVGKFKMQLIHNMRLDSLEGIRSIGLQVDTTTPQEK